MSLPELESCRLRQRAVQETDIKELHRLWTDSEVRKYLWDNQIISLELAAETIRASLRSAETEGLGMWMLFKKDCGNFSGFCGLRRALGRPDIELIYGLWPRWWGQGLATEACQVTIHWLFQTRGIDRVIAGANEDNAASFAVMRRLGMTPLEDDIGAAPDMRYYELRRTTSLGHRDLVSVGDR